MFHFNKKCMQERDKMLSLIFWLYSNVCYQTHQRTWGYVIFNRNKEDNILIATTCIMASA